MKRQFFLKMFLQRNFSFLKKVERKAVDKRYAMNFADFKKMMTDKKNKT